MADVTGFTMRAMPDGQRCDDCDKLATHRIQAAADSFGTEWADLCDDCYAKERERRRQERGGKCEWCSKKSDELFSTRDVDEGMCGATYHICLICYNKQQDAIQKELEDYDPYLYYGLGGQ